MKDSRLPDQVADYGLRPAGLRATNVRYAVLGVLCSLSFITYLDRICISRLQGDIARDLRFNEPTNQDRARLEAGAADNYESILNKDDRAKLTERGALDDPAARRTAAEHRIGEQRSTDRLSWVFAAFLIGYVLFEIPGGWLGDVWGTRLVIALIVLWWSLFTALSGSPDTMLEWFVDNPEPGLLLGAMVVVRFLFGLGEAGAFPNVARVLGRWFPFRDRGRAQGIIWMSSRMGGALSPLIAGGLAAAAGGWRYAFWILGAAGAVWAVGFYLWFRDRPADMPGVNAAERDLIEGSDTRAGSIYDDGHHAGAPWGRLLLSTNMWAIYIAGATISFSWYFYVTFLPKYLKDQYGVEYADSAVMQMLPLLIGGAACLFGGQLSDWLIRWTGSKRWGRALVGLTGFAGAGICALIITGLNDAWSVTIMICVLCAFQDMAVPVIWSLGADVGQRYAGTVAGAINCIGALGGVLSPIVAAKAGWEYIFYIFAASYFLGALAWLRIDAGTPIVGEGAARPPAAYKEKDI